MRIRRRLAVSVIVNLAIVAGAGPALAGMGAIVAGAPAEPGSGSASAEEFRIQLDSPGAPATDRPVEFGFPSSSALVNPLQGSSAQASVAYPGEIALNGPGLCQVVVPNCPLPDYPFIVETNYGTKNDARSQYGMTDLEAKSEEFASRGSATTRAGDPTSAGRGNRSESIVETDPATGGVKSRAEATTETIRFGETLTIGSVHSIATVTQQSGGQLTRSSALEVNGVTVGGQAVGLTQHGFVLGDSPTALPKDNPITEALAEGGLRIRWMAGYDTEHGVVAPSLEIQARGQFPGFPAPSVLIVRVGIAQATAQAGQPPGVLGAADDTPPVAGSPADTMIASDDPAVTAQIPSGQAVGSAGTSASSAGSREFRATPLIVGGVSVELAPRRQTDREGTPTASAAAPPPEEALPIWAGEARGQAAMDLAADHGTERLRAAAVAHPSESGKQLYFIVAVGALLTLVIARLIAFLTAPPGRTS